MTTLRVTTFEGARSLTGASGFLFERDERLFIVTSRHVFRDPPNGHHPDRIEIEVHTEATNLCETASFSMPLYRAGQSVWRDATDSEGLVDVAVLEIDKQAFPESAAYACFTPAHVLPADRQVEIGATLLAVGYPLGFLDSLHRLPVARQAALASSFGLRFQGNGYFLVDARTHRGISGAPVVMRASNDEFESPLPWWLLGVHASRLESSARDHVLDETLGLNAAWYADVLLTLTEAP